MLHLKIGKGKATVQHCKSLFSLPLVDSAISTHENQAYQVFTTTKPQIEMFDKSPVPQRETATYEEVGESTNLQSSYDMKNPSMGLYEN